MANCCDVTYYCEGKKSDLISLFEVLEGLSSRHNRFPYLIDIVEELGGETEMIACCGKVFGYGFQGNVLWITQETSWCEQEDFRLYLEDRFPGMRIYYQELEPCCDLFYTNDSEGKYFPNRYILSYDDNDSCEWYYFKTLEDLYNYFVDRVEVKEPLEGDITFESVYDVIERNNELKDTYHSLYKIEVV